MRGGLPLAGVCGWPVAHSVSPAMMAFWLERAGMAGSYVHVATRGESFPNALKSMKDFGMTGMNVTIPHKETALKLADSASEAARRIGAANLVLVTDRGVHADNTDIIGVKAALDEGGWTPGDGPAVLVGAGGAARAALALLSDLGAEIRILNRSPDKAAALAEEMGANAVVRPLSEEAFALEGAGLVVNATSLGMKGWASPQLSLGRARPGAVVFDMVYAPLETGLLKAARAHGLKTVDGLSMLIGQARPAFEALFGAPPPPDDPKPLLNEILEGRA